jgi:hypothetical protein
MNESRIGPSYDSMLSTDVCMSVCIGLGLCLYGCNEMFCDETTNATNIPFGIDIPIDNKNRSAKRRGKNPLFWPRPPS